MRLSSTTRIWLNRSTALLALAIGVMLYMQNVTGALVLVIVVFLVAVVLELDNRGKQESERFDFKVRIVDEALSVLDRLIVVANEPISSAVWSTKSEEFKANILGDQDYMIWKKFYDNVEARNRYFMSREGFSGLELEKFAIACFTAFFMVYDRLSWVRDSIPQEEITSLLSRAKQSAWTCGFVRDLH